LANESQKIATLYAVEEGNVGILTRVDREALRRARSNFHEWDVVRLPFIDLPVGSHYYTAVGDQSSIAGDATADLTCGIKEHYGFSVDVAFVVAYNSAPSTVANPIIKIAIDAPAKNEPYATPVYITNASEMRTEVPTITLDKSTLSLTAAGSTGTITATTTPNDFVVDWESSDETVATVAGGVVTPLAAGTATITAKITVDGIDYTATCAVTVAE
jgi:hypothetical protein